MVNYIQNQIFYEKSKYNFIFNYIISWVQVLILKKVYLELSKKNQSNRFISFYMFSEENHYKYEVEIVIFNIFRDYFNQLLIFDEISL
jgi:hypothetical protein